MRIEVFNSEALFGYTQQTTFWQDFTIADAFGINAVKDTYRRASKEWKTDKVYMTELVMILNWKSWVHAERGNDELSEVYVDLYYKARDLAFKTLKGDDLKYFIRTTD